MNFKKVVDRIHEQNSTYQFPQQAENLVNSLDTISNDIYSESDRFVFELIQNADDAYVEGQEDLEVIIEFVSPFLIISHTGKEFSEADVKAITSVGNSVKIKNKKQTGYKGIGFKSVFSKSNCVYINSGGFCFRFDKSFWKGQKMPWQIIPIWSKDTLPGVLERTGFGKYPVSTAIKLANDDLLSTKEVILEMFKNFEVLLFLRNITKVRIGEDLIVEKKNKAIESCSKKSNEIKFNLVETSILVNRQLRSAWVVGHCEEIEIDEEVRRSFKGNPKVPQRLEGAKFTSISFAGKIDERNQMIAPDEKSLIFVYLPTKIKTKLPFLINADFLTNASREGFHEDLAWNQWLFEKVGYKSVEWLRALANSKYRYSVGCIVPDYLSPESNALYTSFNAGVKKGLCEIPFIPGRGNRLLRCSEAIEEKLDIEQLFDIDLVVDWFNSHDNEKITVENFIDKKLKTNKRFYDLKVKTFDLTDLGKFIRFLYDEKKFGIKECIDVTAFLYRKFSDDKSLAKIRNIKFLLDQRLTLCAPGENVCFPSAGVSADNYEFPGDFHVLHEDLVEALQKDYALKKWLKEFGVGKFDKFIWVNKVLIQKLKDKSTSVKDLIGGMRFLFKNRRFIDDSTDLKSVYLVTSSNRIRRADECYLSDFYSPEVPIQSYFDFTKKEEDIFVSEKYADSASEIRKWRDFFIDVVGVSDRLYPGDNEFVNPIKCCYYEVGSARGKIDKKYDDYIRREGVSCSSDFGNNPPVFNLHKQRFLEFVSKKKSFAKVFWLCVFREIGKGGYSISSFIKPVSPRLGKGYFKGYHGIMHYNKWAFKNLPLFPAKDGTLRCASEVIVCNKYYSKIGGRELPILDLGEDFDLPQQVVNDREIFNFRKNIILSEYLHILDKLSETGALKEGEISKVSERIGLIYRELLKFNGSYEKEVIRRWGEHGKLLSIENKFVDVSSLYYVDASDLGIGEGFGSFVKPLGKLEPEDRMALFRNFGVKIIPEESRKPLVENAVKEDSLRDTVLRRLPLISLVVSEKEGGGDFCKVLDRLKSRVESAVFYRADELSRCIFDESGNLLSKRSVNALCWSDNVYYVGHWRQPVTMYDLNNELSGFLSRKDISKELNVLLLSSFKDGYKWLESHGVDMSVLPDKVIREAEEESDGQSIHTLNPEQPKVSGGVGDYKSKEEFIDTRNEVQKEISEMLGEKAEGFVFEELVRLYKDKYCGSQILKEEEGWFKMEDVEIIWNAKQGDKYANHDITIIENGEEKFVEVKSSVEKEDENCYLLFTFSEWQLMKESSGRYYVARVFNSQSPDEIVFVEMKKIDHL